MFGSTLNRGYKKLPKATIKLWVPRPPTQMPGSNTPGEKGLIDYESYQKQIMECHKDLHKLNSLENMSDLFGMKMD